METATTEIKNRYHKGKIYVIRSTLYPTLIYVGSTIQSLSKRFSDHKIACNDSNHKAHNLFVYRTMRANGGIENFNIELYEEYPCNEKDELCRREGEVIRLLSTMNYNIGGRATKNTTLIIEIKLSRIRSSIIEKT